MEFSWYLSHWPGIQSSFSNSGSNFQFFRALLWTSTPLPHTTQPSWQLIPFEISFLQNYSEFWDIDLQISYLCWILVASFPSPLLLFWPFMSSALSLLSLFPTLLNSYIFVELVIFRQLLDPLRYVHSFISLFLNAIDHPFEILLLIFSLTFSLFLYIVIFLQCLILSFEDFQLLV